VAFSARLVCPLIFFILCLLGSLFFVVLFALRVSCFLGLADAAFFFLSVLVSMFCDVFWRRVQLALFFFLLGLA